MLGTLIKAAVIDLIRNTSSNKKTNFDPSALFKIKGLTSQAKLKIKISGERSLNSFKIKKLLNDLEAELNKIT